MYSYVLFRKFIFKIAIFCLLHCQQLIIFFFIENYTRHLSRHPSQLSQEEELYSTCPNGNANEVIIAQNGQLNAISSIFQNSNYNSVPNTRSHTPTPEVEKKRIFG